jgi:hypothetical protein
MMSAREHAVWAPVAAQAFAMLDIGVSLVELDPLRWRPIQIVPTSVANFEVQYAREHERERYNLHWFERVRAEGKVFLTEHAGMHDVFAPLMRERRFIAAIVAGPFLPEQPDVRSTTKRWQTLTGKHADPDDPRFRDYLQALLATPVLHPPERRAFVELVETFARLMSGSGSARGARQRIDRLLYRTRRATLGQRMDRAATSMIDERSGASWLSHQRHWSLGDLGLDETPSDVSVLLAADSAPGTGIERLFRRLEWQRACLQLAIETPDAACGRLGEHGVVFLLRPRGRASERRARLLEFVQRARTLGLKKFDLELHVGVGPLGTPETLAERFQVCSAAAEQALYRGTPVVEAGAKGAARPLEDVATLARSVVEAFEFRPARARVAIDHYLQAVAYRSAFRPSVARVYLETLLADVMRVLRSQRTPSPEVLQAELSRVEHGSEALGLRDLLDRYQRALRTLASAVEDPGPANRELALRRGESFIREHLADTLRLSDVARAAGLGSSHFSRLFSGARGVSFEHYVLGFRL